ncbi:carboxypeptidase-like regulatory domain-containing protein [Hymenobacter guriensis]|nr:carboxypeptidase-like regulatory domain-containing protein [Hymenobacter guriensis]
MGNLFAQTGSLQGMLFNRITKQGFSASAQIWFPDLDLGTLSEPDGSFKIYNIPIGVYRLNIKSIGFRDTTIMQVKITSGQATSVNINFPIGCHFNNQKGNECPYCKKQDATIPIVYGFPSNRVMQRAKHNKLKLGGCVTTGCDPHWYCKRDERDF